MPVIQPEGAITTPFSGDVVDAKFAPDGSLLVASGSTVFRIDLASGQVVDQYVIGGQIASFDVSLDGRYLVASNNAGAAVIVRYDMQTDAATEHYLPLSEIVKNPIGDVAFLNDGTVLLAQKGYLQAPLLRFDFATASVTAASPAMLPATLITSADRDTVLVIGSDVQQTNYIYSSASGITATRVGIYDPYGGASLPPPPTPVGAISPDETLFISSAGLTDAQLQSLTAPSLQGSHGLAFSASGDRLYAVLPNSIVMAFDTATWQGVAVYPVKATVASIPGTFASGITNGDILQISGDGRYLSIMSTTGVQVIDLSLALPIADTGNNVVDEGTVQLGLAGNDTLGSAGAQYMLGGEGDDTYLIDSEYNDSVRELANQGTDTILLMPSSAPSVYSMPENVELLTFLGSGSAWLEGNGSENTITGGPSADILTGNEGADTLLGNGGNDTLASIFVPYMVSGFVLQDFDPRLERDTLVGGDGDDTLWIGYGDSADGGAGTDTLNISLGGHTGGVVFDSSAIVQGAPYELGGGSIQNIELVGYVLGTNYEDTLTIATQATTATVDGGGGDDTITANGSAVIAQGGAGLDVFVSGSAADTFDGGDSFDTVSYANSATGVTLVTGSGTWTGPGGDQLTSVERILGSGFADNLSSGEVDSDLWGGGGNDTLTGGAGKDVLVGLSGDDTLINAHSITPGEVFEGDEGFDTLELRPNAAQPAGTSSFYSFQNAFFQVERLVFASTANTLIYAGLSIDQATRQPDGFDYRQLTHVVGGAGFDQLSISTGFYSFNGGTFEVPELVLSNWTSSSAPAGSGDVVMLYAFWPGNYTLIARDDLGATQTLLGNSGNDTLIGSNGADRLDGAGGVNVLNGNGGDDTLIISNTTVNGVTSTNTGAGSAFDGGSGTDFLSFAGPVDFQGTLANIEGFYLSPANGFSLPNGTSVTIAADAFANLPAALTLAGSGTLTVNLAPGDSYDASAFVLADGASITHIVNGSGAGDTIRGLQVANALYGNDGNDTLIGGLGDDMLDGGAGNDMLAGGGGDDVYIVDSEFDVVTEGAGEGTDLVLASVSHQLADNVENLTLTDSGNTAAAGNALANVVTGNAGSNWLAGLAGDDVLDGGLGRDRMDGGNGNDTYHVDNAFDWVVELTGEGTDLVLASASYQLTDHVENLTLTGSGDTAAAGNAQANVVTGNAGNNWLAGLAGNDVLDGGLGGDRMEGGADNDTYHVDNAGDWLIENAGEGTDQVLASATYQLADNIENLTLTGSGDTAAAGNALANAITGNAGNNWLAGLQGDDVLDGGLGGDRMEGGADNDTYHVDNAFDWVIENAGEGTDLVLASITYQVSDHVENLTLIGSGDTAAGGNALANVLTGNAGNNWLASSAGDDVLDGGLGADRMDGGADNDTYHVDNAGDWLIENAGEGTDQVLASISYQLADNVENLTLTGSGDTGAGGNALANALAGNAGANWLAGSAGNDVLDGGLGADRLDGGTDQDMFVFTTALGGGNVDWISDFAAADDTIGLDDAVFAGLAVGALASGAFATGATAGEADDRVIYDANTGALLFDVDGVGGTAAVQFATLSGGLTLTSADFLVI